MARTYRLTPAARLINRLSAGMIKAGVAASYAHILTVRGRTTGRLHRADAGFRSQTQNYAPKRYCTGLRTSAHRTSDIDMRPDPMPALPRPSRKLPDNQESNRGRRATVAQLTPCRCRISRRITPVWDIHLTGVATTSGDERGPYLCRLYPDRLHSVYVNIPYSHYVQGVIGWVGRRAPCGRDRSRASGPRCRSGTRS